MFGRELLAGRSSPRTTRPQQLERERKILGMDHPLERLAHPSSRRQPVIVSNAGLRDAMVPSGTARR